MSRDAKLRLADIIDACEYIERYIEGYDLEAFEQDSKTQDAVIRQFEIIGEAVKSLPQEITDQDPAVPWRKIAGFRDVLAHGYFAVDTSVVWDAAKIQAPLLKDACKKLAESSLPL